MADLSIRDTLARTMRAARLDGLSVPWDGLTDLGKEQWRLTADQIIRTMMADYGIALVRAGDPEPPAPPQTSPVIWKFPLVSSETIRSVRRGEGYNWEIVDGDKVVLTFTMQETFIEAGMVLRGDPEALKIKGLMTRLAAVSEIYRVGAA